VKNTAPEAPRYPIESVHNALLLLLMFRDQELVRVTEVARTLGIAPSTAHRLLAMLQYHGFVRHDPSTRSYVPGRALVDVGLSIVRELDIRRFARPFLEQLRDELGETVHLVMLQGSQVLFVDGVESPKALRAGLMTGNTLPAHFAVSGRVLLAELPPDRFRELYPDDPIAATNGWPAVARGQVERELPIIRDQGYAIGHGIAPEQAELWAVAAPIRGDAGPARAVLAVTAPATRADEAWADRAVATVTATARAISTSLP
jgi:DNA-binding IclR family transcriptional regulator